MPATGDGLRTAAAPVLVLGGTGKTGRRVAARLTDRGLPVRVGSRRGEPRFDWEDRTTWESVLDGVASVYLAYAPDLAVPGATETVAAFTGLAAERGVDRLVLLSGRGEPRAAQAERAVRAAAPRCTVLRANWFAQNFSESFLREAVLAGTVSLPAGAVLEPFVDADDIADVAVAALVDDGHQGQAYELSGPRALTFAGAVAEIAQAADRPVQYVEVSPHEWAAGLRELGVPDGDVSLLSYLFAEVFDGRNSLVADGVERALGRRGRDFADYAREAAAGGAWRDDPESP